MSKQTSWRQFMLCRRALTSQVYAPELLVLQWPSLIETKAIMVPYWWVLGAALLVQSAIPTTWSEEALGPFSKVASREEAERAFSRVDELLGVSARAEADSPNTSESELHALFVEWQQRYGVAYADPQEDAPRFQIFQSNLRKIVGHNKNKAASYWMGLNQFAAMTPEEFNNKPGIPSAPPPQSQGPSAQPTKPSRSTGGSAKAPSSRGRPTGRVQLSSAPRNSSGPHPLPATAGPRGSLTSWETPSYFNWVEHKFYFDRGDGSGDPYSVVPDPVSQGDQCGACWAVAAAAAMEAKFRIQYQEPFGFSVQQLLSCATNLGCALGGWPQQAFEYASRRAVIPDDWYISEPGKYQDDECWHDLLEFYDVDMNDQALASGIGYKSVPPRSASALMAAVAKQPVVILQYDAGLQLYSGGIYNAAREECGTGGHALLVVGWKGNPGQDGSYWIAQNTFGTDWGEPSTWDDPYSWHKGGYIRLKMYPDRTAGLCNMYSYYRQMRAGGYYPTTFAVFNSASCVYTVTSSDTVETICAAYQISYRGLFFLNEKWDEFMNEVWEEGVFQAGQVIKVPCKKQTPCTYVVKGAGDKAESFESIAALYKMPVSVLRQLNPTFTADLKAGHVLRVPGEGCPTVGLNCKYTVGQEDTLWGIADTLKLNVVVLQSLNQGLQADNVYVGQELEVPCSGAAPGRCFHKVKAGQTYATIAVLYKTSEDILQRLNGFAPIRAGRTIQVPCKGNLPK